MKTWALRPLLRKSVRRQRFDSNPLPRYDAATRAVARSTRRRGTRMQDLGRVTYHYFSKPLFRLEIEIVAYPDDVYRASVLLNGVPARHSRRYSLKSALRWGFTCCQQLLDLFGLAPVQISFDEALREVKRQLVA